MPCAISPDTKNRFLDFMVNLNSESTMERITTAAAGQAVPIKLRYDGKVHQEMVLGPCEQKNNGLWYCTTHLVSFQNQMQKDSHIHRGKHQLTWLCFAHGPEQP